MRRRLALDDCTYRESCPACGSRRWEVLSRRTDYALSESFPTGPAYLGPDVRKVRTLKRCRNCTLWFFDWVPSSETIRTLLESPTLKERWRTSDRPGFQRARAVISECLHDPGTILDVGAHCGGFLDNLSGDWTKMGLEPMEATVPNGTGTAVIRGFLEDAELPRDYFDCVTVFDVFEHLSDPRRAVANLVSAVKPGGIVIIETGTTDAFWARRLKPGWYYLNFIEHFQAFNRQSLEHVLRPMGVTVFRCDTHYHTRVSATVNLRSLISVSLFAILTLFGLTPEVWRFLNSKLRPHSSILPPSSIGIEPDHLFLVGRKQAP